MTESDDPLPLSKIQKASLAIAAILILAVVVGLVVATQLRGRSRRSGGSNAKSASDAIQPIPGDPAAGEKLFFSARLACGQCHRFKGRGGIGGPDLSSVIRQYSHYSHLHLAILQPGRGVQPAYATSTITDKDGRVVTGIVTTEEEDPIKLWLPTGEMKSIPRDNVADMQRDAMSPMPNDYADRLTVRELFDLTAFLFAGRTYTIEP